MRWFTVPMIGHDVWFFSEEYNKERLKENKNLTLENIKTLHYNFVIYPQMLFFLYLMYSEILKDNFPCKTNGTEKKVKFNKELYA